MTSLRPLHLVCDALRPDVQGSSTLRDADDTVWPAAIALANDHFVAPALYAALAQTQRLSELPADVHDYLAWLYEANVSRNRRLRQQALELLDALHDTGVRAMLLKGGIALLVDPAGDQVGRMIRDLDLLVPKAESDKVVGLLHSLGYRIGERYPADHNAYGEFIRAGDPAAIDVHFELIDTPHVLPADEVWRRAVPIMSGPTAFFVPSPTDRVLHNVLHAQIHHLGHYYLGTIDLRQLQDFATLSRHHGAAIDWTFIHDWLSRHQLRTPLHAYALAAHRLLGSPWALPQTPTLAARLHYQRCLMQLRLPLLARVAVPLANLGAAFAPHRMTGIYRQRSPLLLRRLRHAARFLHKGHAADWIARLFRSPVHPRGWRR